jgi:hypothetical protein
VPPEITKEQLMQLVERIRAEYLELPTLSLTLPQARRLWAIEPTRCRAALGVLVNTGFLDMTREGPLCR